MGSRHETPSQLPPVPVAALPSWSGTGTQAAVTIGLTSGLTQSLVMGEMPPQSLMPASRRSCCSSCEALHESHQEKEWKFKLNLKFGALCGICAPGVPTVCVPEE